MNKDKCRCTEKLGLGGLGSLMEKLQHSECSVSLVYRVETWCYCVQLNMGYSTQLDEEAGSANTTGAVCCVILF